MFDAGPTFPDAVDWPQLLWVATSFPRARQLRDVLTALGAHLHDVPVGAVRLPAAGPGTVVVFSPGAVDALGHDEVDTWLSAHPDAVSLAFDTGWSDDDLDQLLAAGLWGVLPATASPARLGHLISRGAEVARMRLMRLRGDASDPTDDPTGWLLGVSPVMRDLAGRVRRLARQDGPIIIEGEDGVGRGHLARLIHESGPHSSAPFVVIDLPNRRRAQDLALFGPGGAAERADGGMLVLRLTTPIEPSVAAKLHTLEGTRVVICRSPGAAGRASVLHVDAAWLTKAPHLIVPPLRERSEDVPALVQRVLREFGTGHGGEVTPEAMHKLCTHRWLGNVSELQNAVQVAVMAAGGQPISVAHLPPTLGGATASLSAWPGAAPRTPIGEAVMRAAQQSENGPEPVLGIGHSLDEIERLAIMAALKKHDGNVSATVRELGIGRTTFYRKVRRYKLEA